MGSTWKTYPIAGPSSRDRCPKSYHRWALSVTTTAITRTQGKCLWVVNQQLIEYGKIRGGFLEKLDLPWISIYEAIPSWNRHGSWLCTELPSSQPPWRYVIGHGATSPFSPLSWMQGSEIYLARVKPDINAVNDRPGGHRYLEVFFLRLSWSRLAI